METRVETGAGESQPLLRPAKGRDEAARAKHLSRIMELPDETGGMSSSMTTESTRLSGYSQKSAGSGSPDGAPKPAATVVKRSIGIQLNSPALPLRFPFSATR